MKPTFRIAVLVIGILLSFVLLLAPWRIGATIRPVLNEVIQVRLPAQTDERLVITELDYQRGVFNSTALYRIASQIPGATQLPTLEFRAEITHGPLLVGSDGITFGAARIKLLSLDQEGNSNDTIDLELLVGLDESLSLNLKVDPIAVSEGLSQFSLAGATGTLLLRPDQSAEFEFDIPRLSLRAPEAQLDLTVEGIQLRSHSQQVTNPAAPGNIQLTVTGISNRGTAEFSVANLLAEADLAATPNQAERVDFNQFIRFNELHSQWPLESLDWHFQLQRLPIEVVQDYVIMAAQLQDRIEGGQPIDAAFTQSGLLLGIRLLNTDFNLRHSASLRAYDGEHESRLDISYNGIPTLTDITHLDLNELIAALNIELALRLDLNAVLQSPAANLIDPYVQEGYIILDNGQVQLQSTLQDSELTLNGESVSLQQFF